MDMLRHSIRRFASKVKIDHGSFAGKIDELKEMMRTVEKLSDERPLFGPRVKKFGKVYAVSYFTCLVTSQTAYYLEFGRPFRPGQK